MRLRRGRLRMPGATMVVALGACVLFAPATPWGPPPPYGRVAAVPAPVRFTDDTEHVAQWRVDPIYHSADRVDPLTAAALTGPAGTVHEGEVSGGSGPLLAFVSTRDDPAGEVYVAPSNGGPATRLTCDGAVKSHPVISAVSEDLSEGVVVGLRFLLAYGSTAPGAGNDGHVNIWIAAVDLPVGAPAPAAPDGCSRAVIDRYALPGQRGDNFWPAWQALPPPPLEAGPPSPGQRVIYTSTRDNRLGDLYAQGPAPAAAPTVRLTDGGARYGNTQPVSVYDGTAGAVRLLFTTTRFRPDGSLATATLGGPLPVAVGSAWPGASPPQSSEASVATGVELYHAVQPFVVAYTSTADNPYGGVLVAPGADDGAGVFALSADTVSLGYGTAPPASHPALVPGSDAAGSVTWVYVTERGLAAGVTSVPATGSGTRRQLVAPGPDDSQPAYSPDGRKIAYSQYVPADDAHGQPAARVIMIADADGGGPPVQLATQDGASFDTQPAWSPNGGRIAFTRFTEIDSTWSSAVVMVAPVPTGTAPGPATAVLPPGDDGGLDAVRTLDPSWSPDGRHLIVSRFQPLPDLQVALTQASDGPDTTYTATVRNTSGLATGPATLTFAVAAGPPVSAPITLELHSSDPGGISCVPATRQLRCDLGALDRYAASSVTIVPRANGDPAAPGQFQLKAAVTSPSYDRDLGNNVATATYVVKLLASDPPPPAYPVADPPSGTAPPPTTGWLTANAQRDDENGGNFPSPQLYLLDVATGAGGPLVTTAGAGCSTAAPCMIAGRTPAWSPQGRSVVYDDSGILDLLTLPAALPADLAGGVRMPAPRTLTGLAGFTPGSGGTPTSAAAVLAAAHDPTWTPDGSEVLFAGQPLTDPDNSGIFAIAADGSGLRAVTQGPQLETEPSVAIYPDGAVTLSAAPAAIVVGQQTTLTATASDNGTTDLLAGVVTITIPTGLSVAAAGLPAGCTIASPTISCPVPPLKPGEQLPFAIAATGVLAGTQTVSAAYPVLRDRDPSNNTATAAVLVQPGPGIAVTIAPSQPVGYVGGPLTATITVTNLLRYPAAATLQTGFSAQLQVTGTPSCLTGTAPCNLGTIPAGGSASYTVGLLPLPDGTPPAGYTATLTATAGSTVTLPGVVPISGTATSTATLPVLQPSVQVLPGVQVDGFVALVYGENFPPGAAVMLAWNPGITTYPGPFTVAADGTLHASMLIVDRDVLGQREVVATSVGNQFGPVDNMMLVVPRTEAPPGFLDRG